jgi:hypothetical protein
MGSSCGLLGSLSLTKSVPLLEPVSSWRKLDLDGTTLSWPMMGSTANRAQRIREAIS